MYITIKYKCIHLINFTIEKAGCKRLKHFYKDCTYSLQPPYNLSKNLSKNF